MLDPTASDVARNKNHGKRPDRTMAEACREAYSPLSSHSVYHCYVLASKVLQYIAVLSSWVHQRPGRKASALVDWGCVRVVVGASWRKCGNSGNLL
jgi:hypothetical protein